MLLVPAVTAPARSDRAITAVVAVDADGTVVASSAPSRYPPGRPAASELPAPAAPANANVIKANGESTQYGTPYGSVVFMVSWLAGRAAAEPPADTAKRVAYVYVQAPWSHGFVNPVSAPGDLGRLGYTGSLLLYTPAVLLIAVVPVGVLFGLLASWRLVRRVRRLERATLAGTTITARVPAS
ncbi:MAG TPA: hypothetical protein VHZ03_26035 [Trebonia sp.]|jgi:hypothetical protein|nr:hypothetical protein [Trebonia sp.]